MKKNNKEEKPTGNLLGQTIAEPKLAVEKTNGLESEAVDQNVKEEIARLATLSPLEYSLQRAKASKKLGIRTSDLDAAIAKYRPADIEEGGGLQGEEIEFPDLEPWPQQVNGEKLLREIESVIKKHVAIEDFKIKAIAFWVVHSHLADVADHSARLNLASPMHRCGKSTTLDIIEPMVPRPLTTESITTAAMFRVVQKYKPTLLIDEVDSFLVDNEDMRGLINAGHKPTGSVTRTVGEDHEPRAFKVYCPMVLAGIGDRPATIMDRSITINLRRKLVTDQVDRFMKRKIAPSLKVIGQKIARWAADNRDALIDCEPDLPDCLGDREQDNWRQLVAIADLMSPKLGEEARKAAIKVHEDNKSEDEGAGVKLLADAAAIINALDAQATYVASKVLHSELLKMEDRPWNSWWRGNPITTDKIAKLFKAFNIHPGVHRLEKKPAPVQRAYVCKDILEAAARYVEHPTEMVEDLM